MSISSQDAKKLASQVRFTIRNTMISLHLLKWCVPDDRARDLGAAAEMDPTRPVDADAEGVYLNYRDTLVAWSTRLRQHLTQVAAFQWEAKSARPVRRPDGSLGAPSTPLTTAWLLRPLQGRRMLGDALSRMKITPQRDKCCRLLRHDSLQRAQV